MSREKKRIKEKKETVLWCWNISNKKISYVCLRLQLFGQNLLMLKHFGNSLFEPNVMTKNAIPSTKCNYSAAKTLNHPWEY